MSDELSKPPLDQDQVTFVWDTLEITNPGVLASSLSPFENKIAHLPAAKELIAQLTGSFAATRQVFETIYPSTEARPAYHNDTHACLTAWNATKIYLGYLRANHGRFDQDFFDLLLAGASFHEIDDWWAHAAGGQKPANYQQALDLVRDHLTKKGISTDDFNRVIKLDDFNKTLDQSVQDALELSPENGLLKESNGQRSKLAALAQREQQDEEPADEKRVAILKTLGQFISGADFAQVLDHNYQVKIPQNQNNNIYLFHQGVASLANEMEHFRPDDAIPDGWKTEGKLDWQKVGTSNDFLDILRNKLEPALPYLDRFYDVTKPNELSSAPATDSYQMFTASARLYQGHNSKKKPA
ncbi:hypothetical protein A3F03_00825 [Candidatus Roizmanbacteria bacterium RIFCSPHIGHO2_12_FULL_41_11]|uniref:Uncharacterized protein n=1 Tax=Candidatus Roizmanbacteria bacterium RIFCSPHIGHO2_12_FULL_41_11 TaxID=1802052 RepID=A0A1F7I3M0_9BACT|nr:MAG: hypothetical protein A3F03_00825 [Candidatus Roizmanbacteria bacterium RIFCSPHIGHO2_12_FULL_41_11]